MPKFCAIARELFKRLGATGCGDNGGLRTGQGQHSRAANASACASNQYGAVLQHGVS